MCNLMLIVFLNFIYVTDYKFVKSKLYIFEY